MVTPPLNVRVEDSGLWIVMVENLGPRFHGFGFRF